MSRDLSCTWTVAPLEDPDQPPGSFIEAVLPGAVQLDWARSQGWPEPEHSESWKQYTWMEDRYWLYRCEADVPELGPDQRLHFVCGGIDYAFRVRLSGREIHQQEGMFTPVDWTSRTSGSPVINWKCWSTPLPRARTSQPTGTRPTSPASPRSATAGTSIHG